MKDASLIQESREIINAALRLMPVPCENRRALLMMQSYADWVLDNELPMPPSRDQPADVIQDMLDNIQNELDNTNGGA